METSTTHVAWLSEEGLHGSELSAARTRALDWFDAQVEPEQRIVKFTGIAMHDVDTKLTERANAYPYRWALEPEDLHEAAMIFIGVDESHLRFAAERAHHQPVLVMGGPASVALRGWAAATGAQDVLGWRDPRELITHDAREALEGLIVRGTAQDWSSKHLPLKHAETIRRELDHGHVDRRTIRGYLLGRRDVTEDGAKRIMALTKTIPFLR